MENNIGNATMGFTAMSSVFPIFLTMNWVTIIVLTLIIFILAEQASRLQKTPLEDGSLEPPGPKGWPVIGNLPQLGKTPHIALTALRDKYGDVFKIQLGSRHTVVLNGLAVIKQALVKQGEDFAGRPNFYTFNFIANGKSMGFGDYGPLWKAHRKIAQNALSTFVNDKNNPMELALQEEASVLIDSLCNAGKEAVNPHTEIYLSVGNIICTLCFGKRYHREDEDFLKLVKMNDEFMAYVGAGNPVDIMPWMRHFTKRSFNGFLRILHTMDTFCLKKRIEHLDTYDADEIRDVTDALIKASQEIDEEEKIRIGLTDEHILVTIQELIGAGFDTIATTLQWAALFMATHPQHQEQVQQEIDQIIGHDRLPSTHDAGTMPFTEAVILEIMRHSCIFPFALPHATTCDTYLNGFFIPNKTLIFVNLWSVTRDQKMFPDPEVFDPYRFVNKTGSTLTLQKEAMDNLLPYCVGRRRCPGEQLGRWEIFVFFTSLLQRCKLETLPGLKYTLKAKYGLTLKPQDFKIKVTPRYDGAVNNLSQTNNTRAHT